jgi:hypothetical protein
MNHVFHGTIGCSGPLMVAALILLILAAGPSSANHGCSVEPFEHSAIVNSVVYCRTTYLVFSAMMNGILIGLTIVLTFQYFGKHECVSL